MKFEMPKMNISMFEMENVATETSAVVQTSNLDNAENAAQELVNNTIGAVSIKVTF